MVRRPGRNDACPCGSGKKYKRCCLEALETADRPVQTAVSAMFASAGTAHGDTDAGTEDPTGEYDAVIQLGASPSRSMPDATTPPAKIPAGQASSPSMSFDIDALTEAELLDLNRLIVDRIRFLRQLATHSTMRSFRIGERVVFHPADRPAVMGMITRHNQKTVTVVTDEGQRWNVAPQLLERPTQGHPDPSAA